MIPLNNFTLILLILLFFPSFINPTSMMPTKRNFSNSSSSSNQPSSIIMGSSNLNPNKLRRLPHVFNKVLELPFNSDFDVNAKEHHDCFKFAADVVESDEIVSNGVKAHVVELHPGISKLVIRTRDNNRVLQNVDELQLDLWRFRLPGSARPELATAVYERGQLVVTVPKNGWGENNGSGGSGHCKGSGFKGNFGNPILVHVQ